MAHPGGLRQGPRPGRRLRWAVAAFLVLMLVELAVLIATGRAIGVGWTLLLLVVLVVLGGVVLRREGARTWRALHQAAAAGRPPTSELLDAGLVMVGGVLLLLPGFLSDVAALLLMLPFTRPLSRRWLERLVSSRVLGVTRTADGTRVWQPRRGSRPGADAPRSGAGQAGPVLKGEVVEGEIVEDDPPGRG